MRRWIAGLVLIADTAMDLALLASRLPPLLQHQERPPAFVGATRVAKPASSQRPYRSPSCGAAGLIFVLIADTAMDLALRASRLAPLLQHQATPRFCGSDASREAGELAAIVLIAIPRRCGTCLCPDCVILGRSCAMGFAAPAAPTTSRAAPRFCGSDGSREADELTAAVSIAIVRRWVAGLCPDCGHRHGSCTAGFAAPAAPTTSRAAPRFCRSDGSREAGELTATVSIAIVRRWVAGLCPVYGHRHESCAAGFAAPAAPTTSRAAPRFCGSDGSREAGELAETVLIAIVQRWVAGFCPDCGRRRGSYAAGFATCVAPTTAKTTSRAAPHGIAFGSDNGKPCF